MDNNRGDNEELLLNSNVSSSSLERNMSPLWSGSHEESGFDGTMNERGPVCSCMGLHFINIAFCGCTSCARKDKSMISALTIVIVFLVFAVIITELAEVDALSRAGSNTENVVTVSRSMIMLFKTAFSFLGFGTLALIGQVRTHDPDEEKQRVADKKTGKITQLALGLATIAGILCTVLAFALYEPFMLHVVKKSHDDIKIGRVYCNWVMPAFVFYFQAAVLQTFCLQTGNIGLVVVDATIDLALFSTMVLGWAARAPTHDVVRRIGICNLTVQVVKWVIYAGFVLRPSFIRRFDLFDFTIPKEMRTFVRNLGSNVLWQWLQNVTQALCALTFLSFANQLGDIPALAFNAGKIVITLLSVPSGVLSYYLTLFGSRFLGDKRYVSFWGLYRCSRLWVIILTAFAFVGFASVTDVAVNGVSDTENKEEVEHEFTKVTVYIVFAMITNNLAVYYKGIFLALHDFKVIFIVYAISFVVFGIPVAAIARAKRSFGGLMIGAYLVPDALMCIGFVMYWHRHTQPIQDRKHREHLDAVNMRKLPEDPDWLTMNEALGFPDLDELFRRGSISYSRRIRRRYTF